MKVKPFLSKWGSRVYIGTVVLAIPFWIAVIYLNFAYINNLRNDAFRQIRPWEALFREPWWIFTSFYLIYAIKQSYGFRVLELVRASSKLGVLLAAMTISIVFIIIDIVEVAVFPECAGRNPYWKVSSIGVQHHLNGSSSKLTHQ
jgi:quinol-cytochrome oxidoreductase complex cytochrome b subunit